MHVLQITYLIRLINVTKRVHGKLLIKQVMFTVHKSEITTLIGPNGAGKTTIARLILGLESPSSGIVEVAKNMKIGYVPQKLRIPHHLPITAADFMESITANNPTHDQYQSLLDFSEFKNIKNVMLYKLSGGQFQKLLLAATLMNLNDFVILDEPTQSLDIYSQQEFYHLIEQIKNNTGCSIFMISHDLYTVMKNSDQVICINGHVCCSGKPHELQNNKDFINAVSNIGLYTHHHDHRH